MKRYLSMRHFCVFLIFAWLISLVFSACASRLVTTAEEYFSLGMAYFDLGRAASDSATRTKYFLESEKWLNRARMVDKTKNASEYNLGRIAFETGRYQDAAKYFEGILKKDPDNVLALQAASYTRIKTGEIELAEAHYRKLLTLIPESADDGYNYALVLYHMEKYEEAEQVLNRYEFEQLDNYDSLLLYARTLKALDKIEAAEVYARWLANNKDAKVRCEYAAILETQEFYAKALEEYQGALEELPEGNKDPLKSDVRFYIARLLLIADSTSDAGIKELETAREEGFAGIEELEKLIEDTRISEANINSIKLMLDEIKLAAAAPVEDEPEARNFDESDALEDNSEQMTDSSEQ